MIRSALRLDMKYKETDTDTPLVNLEGLTRYVRQSLTGDESAEDLLALHHALTEAIAALRNEITDNKLGRITRRSAKSDE